MEVDVDLACGVELVPVRRGLGIERCDRRLADVVAEEALRPIEQRLALTRPGDGEPHVPGVLAADRRDRDVLPRRRHRLREVTEVTAEQLGQVRGCVRITRNEHLERGTWRHHHDALVVPIGQTDGAPDRARQRAGVGDPGIATVERDLDHVVGQRVDSRRTQGPGGRGSDRHMVGWHRGWGHSLACGASARSRRRPG